MVAAARRGPGDRAGIDRERILAAAHELDAASITMQAVADRLGVTRKALSHHVTDRETLLGLLAMESFARRFRELRVEPAAPWRRVCRDFVDAVVAGALAAGPLAERVRLDPDSAEVLDTTEAVVGALVEAGLDDEDALRAVVLLTTLSLGHARDRAAASGGERPRPSQLRAALDAGDGSHAVLERISRAAPDTYGDEQLRYSVETVLDGIEVRLLGSSASR